ncbi:MAG TPA: phage holin family protein [Steroidobacteraceae bacterium]
MRRIWTLSRAAPALLRHAIAYIELAGLDLARTQSELTRRLIAGAIIAICALFTLLLGCLAVVACTWDTPHRVAAIAWMGGGFLLIAVAAAIYLSRAARARLPMFAQVRREWREDRVILERIVSDDDV